MTSPVDEWNRVTQFEVQSWANASKYRYRKRQYLLKHLIPKGETVCFLAAPEVETLSFAQLIAFHIAKGQNFEPFVGGKAEPVLLCYGDTDPECDLKSMHRVSKACADEADPTVGHANLFYYHPNEEEDSPSHLDTHEGQRALMRSLPKGCKAVLFPNSESWFHHDRTSNHDSSPPHPFIAKLNKAGIAVVLFEQASKKASTGCALVRKASNIIRLTADPGAPTGIGGGFNIVRNKLDKQDKVPATIQFWYTELDDVLKYGWEFRDPASVQSAKQVTISLRQIEVARLLKLDMPQKTIAAELGVDAATISRDITKLKADAAAHPQTSALAEEWDSTPNEVKDAHEAAAPEGKSAIKIHCFGRGIGKSPINRDGDESMGSEMMALEALEAPPRVPRVPGRGIGKVPVNRGGDDSDPHVTGDEG